MTADDMRLAAMCLLRYAAAIETKLYIDMRIPQAHENIAEARKLAEMLTAEADNKENFRSIPD